MTLNLKHFDTRLNEWIKDPYHPSGILTEQLENTLLEAYFPGVEFSFGHLDENTTIDDLYNHPNGDVLLFSSKTRLLYGPKECLETIDKLCPDRKDRGAYGSLFLGSCHEAIAHQVNLLVVDDETGENGGILEDDLAWKQVGDCHGKISPQLALELSGEDNKVIQHRLAIPGEYRFGKGTLAPKDLSELDTIAPEIMPELDLIVPISSFKGGDQENDPIKPGLYQVPIWLGEKDLSRSGKMSISQLHASFPEGIKDFLLPLEDQAYGLKKHQNSHQALAEYYCQRYEQRKGSSEIEPDDHPMYQLIKTDLEGYQQILESQKVVNELKRFVQNEWRDIALGKTIKFDRGTIIPSKELKHGEICVPYLPEGEEIINFRSPLLNSNGVCISKNVHVPEAYNHQGLPLEGVIVVNDEDKARIEARLNRLKEQGIETDEIFPRETETERQGRDFDGDTIGVALAKNYPHLSAEIKSRNLPENAYEPIKKEKKASFFRADGSQPPFEEIALFMSDSISVGIINNHATALEALESEIDILSNYGTFEQQSQYVLDVGKHYQKLILQEGKKLIKDKYRERIEKIASLAQQKLDPETIASVMKLNRSMYHDMVAEAGYQNQLAVDIFKSNRAPDLNVVQENKRLLHRIPQYMSEKKKSSVYLNSGIKTSGFSPVELMIEQTNHIFAESRLQAKAPEQFKGLFPEDYTPAQKLSALKAKKEYDQLFDYAITQRNRLKNETGPVLKVTTQKGATLEISNLNHDLNLPDLTQLNLQVVTNPQRHQSHKLIALAEIREGEYQPLGTVSEISRRELNLKPGAKNYDAQAKLIAALTENQVKLYFHKAAQFAQEFYQSLPNEEKASYAAAAWHLCHSARDNQTHEQQIGNFVYATFPEEIREQLQQFQVKELTITGLQKPHNQVPESMWNQGQTLNFEIKQLDDLSPTDSRYGKKILFVEGKEMATISDRYLDLPNHSAFQGTIKADNIATASLKIPNGETPIKFGKVNRFDYATHHFRGEKVKVQIEQYQPPPIAVLKLNNQVIGELDQDSVKLLQEKKELVKDKSFEVRLNSYGNQDNFTLHTLATLDEQVSLKLNHQGLYAYKKKHFDNQKATLQLDFQQNKPSLAVKIGEQVAGVFTPNQKASLQALMNAYGKTSPQQLDGITFEANITSNLTIASVQIIPETVQLGEIKSEPEQSNISNTLNKSSADCFLFKMKQLPSLAWKYKQHQEQKYGICVDYQVRDPTATWLAKQGVKYEQVDYQDPIFEEETQRGYSVFTLDKSSLTPDVENLIHRSCGQWLDANVVLSADFSLSPYHQRLQQIPLLSDRRREIFLNTMSQPSQTSSYQKNPLASLEPLNSSVAYHMQKDIAMAEVATQFIGKAAAPAHVPSSTRNYQQAWRDRANTGQYSNQDTIMVSGSGPWRGVTHQQIQATFSQHYQPLLDKAIASQASFVVGNAPGTDKLVQAYLQEHNYQLKLTNENFVQAKPMVQQIGKKASPSSPKTSSLPVHREPWEKRMLTLALKSLGNISTPTLSSDRGSKEKKGIFAQKYLAIHDLQTDTLSIEDTSINKVIYQAQRGKASIINNFSDRDKSMFICALGNNQPQMER